MKTKQMKKKMKKKRRIDIQTYIRGKYIVHSIYSEVSFFYLFEKMHTHTHTSSGRRGGKKLKGNKEKEKKKYYYDMDVIKISTFDANGNLFMRIRNSFFFCVFLRFFFFLFFFLCCISYSHFILFALYTVSKNTFEIFDFSFFVSVRASIHTFSVKIFSVSSSIENWFGFVYDVFA